MNPEISVIIPTQGKRDLSRILTSLSCQTLPRQQFEIILVLDGDTPATVTQLESLQKSFQFFVKDQPKSGAAAARNRGASEAHGQLLVFLDDDVSATPELLRLYRNLQLNAKTKVLTFGPVSIDPKSPDTFLKQWVERQQVKYFEDCLNGKNVGPYYFTSANFSIRKEVFHSAGGFDEEFKGYGWEEADLGIRLKERGVHFIYLPEAAVSELYTKDWKVASGDHAFEKGKNEVRFVHIHPSYRIFSTIQTSFFYGVAGKCFLWLLWQLPMILKVGWRLIPVQPARFRARYTIHYWLGVKESRISLQELKEIFGKKLLVLGYHDVVPDDLHRYRFDVSQSSFLDQMTFLEEHGFHSISLEDLLNWLDGNTPLPDKPVLITIDDGYASLRTEVYPLLKELNFDAVVFLCPGLVGKENIWDQERGMKKKLLLNWDEVGSLSDFSFGAHSMTHQDLRAMTPFTLREDLESCKKEISERMTGPLAFCYPFGAADQEAMEAVQAAGFDCAFTAENGFNFFDTNRYLLRRVLIERSDVLPFFRFKVRFGRGVIDLWKDRFYAAMMRMTKYFRSSFAAQSDHG